MSSDGRLGYLSQCGSGSLRAAADTEAPMQQAGAVCRDWCHPRKLCWRESDASSLSHSPHLLVFLTPPAFCTFHGIIPGATRSHCSLQPMVYTYLSAASWKGRMPIHRHPANKIPPWAKQAAVSSPGLQGLIRSCLVAAVTCALGAIQTSTPACSVRRVLGLAVWLSNQAAHSRPQVQTLVMPLLQHTGGNLLQFF